jgi:hypothetical protein
MDAPDTNTDNNSLSMELSDFEAYDYTPVEGPYLPGSAVVDILR